jgi:hypothetical protein
VSESFFKEKTLCETVRRIVLPPILEEFFMKSFDIWSHSTNRLASFSTLHFPALRLITKLPRHIGCWIFPKLILIYHPTALQKVDVPLCDLDILGLIQTREIIGQPLTEDHLVFVNPISNQISGAIFGDKYTVSPVVEPQMFRDPAPKKVGEKLAVLLVCSPAFPLIDVQLQNTALVAVEAVKRLAAYSQTC